MKKDELERLIWEQLDGSFEAADRARLEEHLAEDPEARRLEAEIATLARELDGVPEVPTPPEVRAAVRTALDAASPIPAGRPATPGFSLLGGFFRQPSVRRLAWAAAGLVIAVVAFQLATGPVEQQPGIFSGTAGLGENGGGGATKRFALAAGAELGLGRHQDGLRVDLELTPGLPAARISVTGRELELADSAGSGGARFQLDEAEGGLRIAAVGPGRVRLAFLVPDPGAPLSLEVETDDELLLSLGFRLEELPE